ncbi:PAS domain-containing protein [Methylocystis sp. MJC1]|jgi:PAS domain S-box-containing protein|uniref:PAS domain-containing hybrid sensor histidine kinase/response regulator n=1 Tax=Methylocystis sp. MJC1 TaxID=2654282 RepID=UPI0013EDF171|nr:PAS domain-containing protein [Methylocystis sp. MJC1]KAF2990473.1 Autoinducer 2 sensor kinase/phosphatase LuxQ [Methylocystis sp. MJC1]MBU6528268.1 PAS domain-containing protein [Methylocystis sp. MJC1]UZX11176.1 PAS domain-containing protein [Methylocystis sp. MJC1]
MTLSSIWAFVAGRDISALKQTEKKLCDKDALLQTVIDSSPDAIFVKDRGGRMLLANPATLAAIGKPAEFCIGKTDEEFLLNPDDARAIMAHDRRIIESGQAENFDESLLTPIGMRCYRNSKAPLRDCSGNVIGLIGVARDITELKEAEAALRASEERFRALTQAVPAIIWETDAAGENTFVTDLWRSYTGLGASQSVGCGWMEALHSDDLERFSGDWAEAIASGERFDCRYRLRATDGSYRWFLGRALPQLDAEGRILRWVGSCSDIDDIVCAQSALADADRRKEQFLATLAHELRNPLAPISSAVHVLKRKCVSENACGPILDLAQRQVDHLTRLVDQLLEISRISRGKVELRKENVLLADFLRPALETCQPLIDKKKHHLIVKVPEDPLWLFGDPVRLAQIAANLINNAAKYTLPGGLIEVAAAREGDEVALRVRDNGVGIDPDMLPHVFDLFAQSDSQIRLSEGGLGIGLALARDLVELHGGRVMAYSDGVGRGAEFVAWLPLSTEPAAVASPAKKAAAEAVGTPRALVIDDNRDGANSFSLLLEALGATVCTVYDGHAGVAAIDQFEPDMVFLDLGMPDIDGYEAARRIRAASRGRPLLLVALTGWGQEEDHRRTREAGFDLHLTKPASLEAVEDLLERARSAGAVGETALRSCGAAASPSGKE